MSSRPRTPLPHGGEFTPYHRPPLVLRPHREVAKRGAAGAETGSKALIETARWLAEHWIPELLLLLASAVLLTMWTLRLGGT